MAVITPTRKRVNYVGSRRTYYMTLPAFTSGDTLTVGGLHLIEAWGCTLVNTDAIGGTVSGNVITTASTGAETAGALAWATGY